MSACLNSISPFFEVQSVTIQSALHALHNAVSYIWMHYYSLRSYPPHTTCNQPWKSVMRSFVSHRCWISSGEKWGKSKFLCAINVSCHFSSKKKRSALVVVSTQLWISCLTKYLLSSIWNMDTFQWFFFLKSKIRKFYLIEWICLVVLKPLSWDEF